MSRFTHFLETFGQKVHLWVKNSVSWTKSALLHVICCKLYWVKLANLQLRAKTMYLSRNSKYALDEKIYGYFDLAETLLTFATLRTAQVSGSTIERQVDPLFWLIMAFTCKTAGLESNRAMFSNSWTRNRESLISKRTLIHLHIWQNLHQIINKQQ